MYFHNSKTFCNEKKTSSNLFIFLQIKNRCPKTVLKIKQLLFSREKIGCNPIFFHGCFFPDAAQTRSQ